MLDVFLFQVMNRVYALWMYKCVELVAKKRSPENQIKLPFVKIII